MSEHNKSLISHHFMRPSGVDQRPAMRRPGADEHNVAGGAHGTHGEPTRRETARFIDHMSTDDARALRPGHELDHRSCIIVHTQTHLCTHNRDSVGKFVLARITDKHHTMLRIHYRGWDKLMKAKPEREPEQHMYPQEMGCVE